MIVKEIHIQKKEDLQTNGIIVDFSGLFYGRSNDSTIRKQILEDPDLYVERYICS